MAVDATVASTTARRSLGEVVGVVLGPVGQLLAFIVGSAVSLSLIVVVLALVLSPGQPDIMQRVVIILPQVIIDGLVRGFLFATIALGYTMVYGVLVIRQSS